MRTTALRPCIPSSAWTNSKPCSVTTRSAISRMRSAIPAVSTTLSEPPSAQKNRLARKRKSGREPTDETAALGTRDGLYGRAGQKGKRGRALKIARKTGGFLRRPQLRFHQLAHGAP